MQQDLIIHSAAPFVLKYKAMKDSELLYSSGSAFTAISDSDLAKSFISVLEKLGPKRRVLAIPPDATRSHSRANVLLEAAYKYYGDSLAAVMPALGTHRAMDEHAAGAMYPGIPFSLFRSHAWRRDVVELGRVPAEFVHEVSEGLCSFDWPAQVNRLVRDGGFDLILSLGQVVPHEVVGMANYTKNVLVGTGGKEGIDRSHWLGAAYGIERCLGRIDTPVRAVLDYAQEQFASSLPILYALTVIGQDSKGRDITRGFYAGFGRRSFEEACALSASVNIIRIEKPVKKMVVYLDPASFKSSWLGNKAVYRSRLAIADGGELVVLAPGLDSFGEDKSIDETIRDYGYCGTERVRELVNSGELAYDLAGAAHLAHGSSDGRFNIVYAPGGLSKKEIESVGYDWADCKLMLNKYDIKSLVPGWNKLDGEEFYFIANPALGLWALESF